MAITNAQQYQQLVNPPMKGKRRPGYRGDAAAAAGAPGMAGPGPGADVGDGPASTGDRGDRREQRAVATTLGISPTTQSALGIDDRGTQEQNRNQRGLVRAGRIRAIERFIDRPTFGFTDAAKFNLTPLPLRFLSGLGGLFTGSTKPPPTFTGGGGGDAGQDIPYWAQLGFNSEEEYLASLRAQAPSTMEQEPEVEDPFKLARRFRAKGGIMNADVVGGEFDFESARQMYGLGKLVKKVTKTVKKIAKSDIGKAAILAAGGYYLGGGNLFGLQRAGMSGFKFANLPGAGFFAKSTPVKLAAGVPDRLAFNAARTAAGSSSGGLGIGTLIGGTAIAAGLLTPEEEAEAEELSRGEGIDIDAARNAILAARQDDFRARRFRAEGGSMKEPVAKKTMPLLDLDGKEMDLRAEGGFVPIGRMEKADDVPARLSKNEFVFTADAVRNAGDGDVDKGAEVMYNMMKNLEAGGEVSKESQGLEGARRMFQTSKRLEEVL